jgi:hypothetical protein
MKLIPVLLVAISGCLLAVVVFGAYRRKAKASRAEFIRSYVFPKGLLERLNDKWPHLTEDQRLLVGKGLRQFFLAHAQSGRFVSMPSQVVDELWHQFILYTKAYADFCNKAFGHFMHHTPAVVLSTRHRNNDGLRRTWWYACKQERIDPSSPSALPLLFALDTQLVIPNGFIYYPQCEALRVASNGDVIYCGGDFASSSSDGGIGGFDDIGCGNHSGGDAGSDGGSDGGGDGGGCGGGCGGGGD